MRVPDPQASTPISETQTAAAVLMIRPAKFFGNVQTAVSNRFQHTDDSRTDVHASALREFDALVEALVRHRVRVIVVDDTPTPAKPDAVFPNNWVSTHSDGSVVFYPMLAPNRRIERRGDVVRHLIAGHNFRVERRVDLSLHEHKAEYLEGTGSVVLDRANRLAYACLSPRTHPAVLSDFEAQLGYRVIAFHATDGDGVAIYHTNVMLAIGRKFAVVCAESIASEDRTRVLRALGRSGRDVIEISRAQMERFAANILELTAAESMATPPKYVVALSQSARDAFTSDQLARLVHATDELVTVPIPTIERYGGGSVRCMLAEIHLPAGSIVDSGTATISVYD